MELCTLEELVKNSRVGKMSTFLVGKTFSWVMHCLGVCRNDFKCELVVIFSHQYNKITAYKQNLQQFQSIYQEILSY